MLELGNYQPKQKIVTNSFIIRKIMAADAAMDYAAVMSSVDAIKAQRGGTWPNGNDTLEENSIDLAWHQRDFECQYSFAYVVTRLDGTEELGWV